MTFLDREGDGRRVEGKYIDAEILKQMLFLSPTGVKAIHWTLAYLQPTTNSICSALRRQYPSALFTDSHYSEVVHECLPSTNCRSLNSVCVSFTGLTST